MLEDRSAYWDAYREVTMLPTEEFHSITAVNSGVLFEPLHFVCAYCGEDFPTLARMQEHYKERNLGENLTLIPASRRGSESLEAWEKNRDALSAPTIRAISKD